MLAPRSEEHFNSLWKSSSFFIAIVVFFITIVIGVFLNNRLGLDLLQNMVLFLLLGSLYLIFLMVLFEQNTREIGVVKERVVEVPHEVRIKEIHESPRYIYVDKREDLKIPKYDYIGSTDRMVFHKRGCRFAKIIKKKYKVSNNSRIFFTQSGYEPCKSCKP